MAPKAPKPPATPKQTPKKKAKKKGASKKGGGSALLPSVDEGGLETDRAAVAEAAGALSERTVAAAALAVLEEEEEAEIQAAATKKAAKSLVAQAMASQIAATVAAAAMPQEAPAPAPAAAPALAPAAAPAPPALKLIITGAPASGKGTQAERIIERYGVVHLSTGDILRAAAKAKTPLGVRAEEFMSAGQLVPDELIISLVVARLGEPDCAARGWMLDGFPRTAGQAAALRAAGMEPDVTLCLDVPDDVLVDRVCTRRLDPVTGRIYNAKALPTDEEVVRRLTQRPDDTEPVARKRLATYYSNLEALRAACAPHIARAAPSLCGRPPSSSALTGAPSCLRGCAQTRRWSASMAIATRPTCSPTRAPRSPPWSPRRPPPRPRPPTRPAATRASCPRQASRARGPASCLSAGRRAWATISTAAPRRRPPRRLRRRRRRRRRRSSRRPRRGS